MKDLKYEIGGIDINSSDLILNVREINPAHRFIVREKGNILLMYIGHRGKWGEQADWRIPTPDLVVRDVIERFGFDFNDSFIIGGGKIYIRENGQLVFMDSGCDYGSISNKVAQKFGELLLPELRRMGFNIKEISTEINEDH